MTTRNGSHSVTKIVNALDVNIKRILLLIHSFSGCDTVSSMAVCMDLVNGKMTILKMAVSTNEVFAAGLFCSMEIKPRHLKISDFSATIE